MLLIYEDRGLAKSGTQLAVLAGTVYVGSIRKTMQSIMAKDSERWDWWLESNDGPPGYRKHGQANSLPEAKAELERMWALWLDAAGLMPRP